MYRHTKRMHSSQILVDIVKNGHINDVKVEDGPLLDIKKPAQEVPTQQNEIEKEIKFVKNTPQLKKDSTLRLQRREKRKIILEYCRSLTKAIKELEKIEAPRRSLMYWNHSLLM